RSTIICQVLLFQGMTQVAQSIFLTLHFKYATVYSLTNKREISKWTKFCIRLFVCAVLEIPVAARAASPANQQDIQQYLIDEVHLYLLQTFTTSGAVCGRTQVSLSYETH
ncbi:hypothetical protein PMAYCL1PPCAC_27712, partial [Pristionchus mayeri]